MSKPPLVCQVAFSVKALKRTYRWYQDMFGFLPSGGTRLFRGRLSSKIQGLPNVASTTWWLIDRQAFMQLEMFEFERPEARPRPEDWRPCDIGYTMVGLHVSDFDATVARLVSAGVELLSDPIGAPARRRVCVLDPEGVLLELMEDDPRTTGAAACPRPDVPVAVRSISLSVSDLDRSRRFFVDTLNLLEASGVELHRPEHEALWRLEDAERDVLLLRAGDFLLELREYKDPVGRPWPESYRISDQGLLNIALGFRKKSDFDASYERVVDAGYRPNWRPFNMLSWAVVYVNDDQGFSVEMLHVKKWFDRFLGFLPQEEKRLVPTLIRWLEAVRRWPVRKLVYVLLFVVAAVSAIAAMALLDFTDADLPEGNPTGNAAIRKTSAWDYYGGDPGGTRHAPLKQITPDNVRRLEVAWAYHTGDLSGGTDAIPSTTAFEATPILVGGRLVFCTPFNRVIALDPATGVEHWTFDPGTNLSGKYVNQLTCRGVSAWTDPDRGKNVPCRERIFTATNDAFLFAIDAANGKLCSDFGHKGKIDLNPAVGEQRWQGEYQVTSPPAIFSGLVVVGAAVADNERTDAPSGVVRAFDARSGALSWAWDLAPPGFDYEHGLVSDAGYALGTPNVWAPLSVDVERGLVLVPTGNPAPDFYRGTHPYMDFFGSSVVALEAGTGKVVWRFKTVHRDLWDFDVPAQPTLFSLQRDGLAIPAVVQATKMGHLFVLDREHGKPLFPIEYRPVPQDGAPGEPLSPTQPFPVKPEPLVRQKVAPDDAYGLTFWDRGRCRERIASLRNDGIFTPPTLQGSLMFPGSGGGSNWGGVAVDAERQILVANVMEVPWVVRLFPHDLYDKELAGDGESEIGRQDGTPYGMRRSYLASPWGLPCTKPPWGTLNAIDLSTGDLLWKVPLGTVRDLAPFPILWKLGVPNLGGPIVTAGGLVFIAAAMDDYLRAFDIESGEELWRGRLPAGGQATPMTYEVQLDGGGVKQFVVIAAGGNGRAGTRLGDVVMAFSLPDGGD